MNQKSTYLKRISWNLWFIAPIIAVMKTDQEGINIFGGIGSQDLVSSPKNVVSKINSDSCLIDNNKEVKLASVKQKSTKKLKFLGPIEDCPRERKIDLKPFEGNNFNIASG